MKLTHSLFPCKVLQILLFILLTSALIVGFNLGQKHLTFNTHLTLGTVSFLFYLWAIKQIFTISDFKLINNTLILKNSLGKSNLMPLEQTKIKTLIKGRNFAVFRIKYHIDGIRNSALVLTSSQN